MEKTVSRNEVSARLESRVVQYFDAGHSRHGNVRADVAAWLIVAFWGSRVLRPQLEAIGRQLQERQLPDGRVPINPEFPEAAWPTPLAMLAWQRQGNAPSALAGAQEFLLRWHGLHYPSRGTRTIGHDTSLRGWPWVDGTHSWIEPTVLSLLALGACGRTADDRCVQARRMILNRQLSGGGWNFGNTTVYGLELRPMPHSTGMALTALSRAGEAFALSNSVRYLDQSIRRIRTPLSLGWGIIGLTASDELVEEAPVWIDECLEREAEVGGYDMVLLCLLQCALHAKQGHPLLSGPAA